ncbi:Short-chain dehydrogenase/reductase SDR [Pseudomonas coronafaciens pv. garcae]|uniref:SDR family oxidoreductase n=3 Tax=Pseudomonas syringae group TaxID=136849 RepID=A0AAE6QJD8_9PSED|nr:MULTISPECIES: SDR family oxidoreductase [Pseudomonas syringae group]KGS14594.1 oxidoreductase [Pseudomonas coronafaciens]MCF5711071.1 SDR family oxidoreductase [Pseudomonas tremae]QGT83839.1 SDR family oxidoreductase [Pseudomonas coronafaciens pv. coronafaciens]QIQ71667.1 2-keto-3-deoxy-L-fuconate dehydrogenase [Pseudomonas coronafaciens]RMM79196.1 Short-chain dehydrogenase/reductase SDR [Pseudomonas coronafaciens pv. striafaciens]
MTMSDKRVLITAAGQGIGLASAKAFVEAGAEVIATDLDLSNLSNLSGISGLQAIKLDVTSAQAIRELSEQIGPIDVLFNCAGYVHSGTILECDEAAWLHSMDLNVTAMYRMIQAFLPGMLSRGGGSIINMASVASSVKGVPNRFAYSASKAAVIGLTKSVAADFIGQGIRCNAICPGTVDSPSLRMRIAAQARQQGITEAQVYQQFVDRQPMGRIGSVEEIAQLVIYLGSDASSYTSGAVHVIDGGMSI